MSSSPHTRVDYSTHGPITDPHSFAHLLDVLPDSVAGIVDAIHGLFIHAFWTERYGFKPSPSQMQHVRCRTMPAILAAMHEADPAPLNEPRAYERRFIGNCRDHSVFLCAALRSKGIPARARCGFARYFLPGHFEDHWVCEYWNAPAGRWQLVDAQLDDLQRKVLGISFDPLDLPKGQFVTGAEAWQMCRSRKEDPEKFGIGDMHGLWFVRGDLGRDLAALNKVELLPWDCWGMVDRSENTLTRDDYALLDRAAAAIISGSDEVYTLYQSNLDLKVPRLIQSYLGRDPVEVDLGFAG